MKLSRMVSASGPVDHTCKKLCCIVDQKLHSLYMKALDFMDKLTPEIMKEIDEAMGSKP